MKLSKIIPALTLLACGVQSVYSAPKMVVGYYPYWAQYAQFSPKDLRLDLVTHMHYGYAAPSAGELALADGSDQGNFEELARICAERKIPLMLSIGGPGAEESLREASASVASTQAMAQSAVQWINKYHLAGVELDWQNPGSSDMESINKLAKALDEAVDEAIPGGLVAATVYAKGNESSYSASVLGKLDYVTVFALDNMNADQSTVRPDASMRDVAAALGSFTSKGFDSEKLVAVFPLYAKSFSGAKGLGSSHNGVGSGNEGLLSYKELMDKFDGSNYKVDFDAQTQSEIAVSESETIVFSGIPSAQALAKTVQEQSMGGVALFDVTLDRKEPIVSVLVTFNQKLRPEVKIKKK